MTTIESRTLGAVPVRVARPAGAASSAVVVLHQAPGWSPQVADWLTRLGDAGHLAVAPLLLHHRGVESVDPGERFGGDLGAFAAFLPGDDLIASDVDEVLAFVRREGVDGRRTGVVGFSYGGRAAFLTAARHELGAAVTFYGTGIQRPGYPGNEDLPALADHIENLRTPWLGLYGETDFLLQPGELDEFETALEQAPASTEVVRYPDAGHAFDIDIRFGPDAPSSLVPAAAADATSRAEAFLGHHLG
ncbi:dienelactone hydrolase family protein [Klenkia sp. LSe6-5]|uniref:Dienelactone hydrolase family protein n=1 Tax=Klenkia sesuvii TaxID=3103137 RepID=A0ABU8DQN0_9ACTN